MKALTVQQPWAWAILHGGKLVENRTWATKHRGELAVHAGARLSERGCQLLPDYLDRANPDALAAYTDPSLELAYGAVLGTVDLIGCHVAGEGCCDSLWGEHAYDEHRGRTRRDLFHWELDNVRPLAEPVPCRGALQLWTVPPDVQARVELGVPA